MRDVDVRSVVVDFVVVFRVFFCVMLRFISVAPLFSRDSSARAGFRKRRWSFEDGWLILEAF
jgi:hypothetical protein